jgi:hypothetical protein
VKTGFRSTLERADDGGGRSGRPTSSYAEERSAFLLMFIGYHCGNWIVDLAGLDGPRPLIVPLIRGIATAALVVAFLARSRRWDSVAVAVLALGFAVPSEDHRFMGRDPERSSNAAMASARSS